MRDKINVLYYPDSWVDHTTLVKAILLFDELHFMDRPSMFFGSGSGQMGTIGAASPLRQYEASFRNEGVPFYVHPAPMGPVQGEWHDQIRADVDDPRFLKRFQEGLGASSTFRNLHIPPGNYGAFGDQDSVAERILAVDLAVELKGHHNATALFEDPAIRPMDLSNAPGCAKQLIFDAMVCSAKLNFALNVGSPEGFFPLADASPFGDLLGTKYARAVNALTRFEKQISLTDLSFAIFDELVSAERVRKLSIRDAIRFRKTSENARDGFLEHLAVIQTKQADVAADGDYAGAIEKLINSEIKPAAQTFRNKLRTVDEALFGAIAKGVIAAAGGSSFVTLYGDLSWPKILMLATGAAAYLANATIDAIVAGRAIRRECSISYILSLDE